MTGFFDFPKIFGVLAVIPKSQNFSPILGMWSLKEFGIIQDGEQGPPKGFGDFQDWDVGIIQD